MFNTIRDFFSDSLTALKFVWDFSTDPKISRLRVFLVWEISALIPSFIIYNSINHWQTHIPGVNSATQSGSILLNMIIGTSIIPLLFFITNGLRGFHKAFNSVIDFLYSRLERKSVDELQVEYGTEGIELLKRVNLGKFIAGFLLLEILIVGWATVSYFLFGGNLTGLAWLGYVGDDLFMGAVVFILESIYCIFDGIAAAPSIYRLKVATTAPAEEATA